MATAVKRLLSFSTDGKGILINAVGPTGTSIHTAITGTTPGSYDEIWLKAYNSDSATHLLTIEFGGEAVPNDNVAKSIPPQFGEVWIIEGGILQNGKLVSAFADSSGKVVVFGYVNRITD